MHTKALKEETLGRPVLVSSERQKSGTGAVWSLIAFAILTLGLMLFEFGGALNSYFTSDDLNHITYAYRMFSNNGELFFRTFSTVWMQDNSTEIFYRPLIEVSFAIDQFFSHANPLGYHIANFLYSFVAAFAVLSIARSLAQRFAVPGGNRIGYAAALLFAVSPLHTEVTTWLIGRVDGLSTMFYLIGFALFLRLPDGKNAGKCSVGWLSLASFASALLCKEMAASLPFVVFACSLFLSKENNLAGKLRGSLLTAAPYFALLSVYFVIRYLACGAILGGYVGAVGEANVFSFSSLVDRFAHFWKVAYPFNEELIERRGLFEMAFRTFYIGFGIFLVSRIRFDRFGENRLKLIGFLFSWLVLQFLPLYQVFMIHSTLAGSRLFYMSTAVLAIIVAVSLITADPLSKRTNGKRALGIFSTALFVILVGLSVLVGNRNNQSWIMAAAHVEELQAQINNAVAVLPGNQKLLIAYVPIQLYGAHMFNRYYLIQSLISPPLLNPDLFSRVTTLEPRFYTYDHLIPSGALRKKLADNNYRTVYWDTDQCRLADLAPGADFADFSGGAAALPELTLKVGRYGMTDITAKTPFKTSAVRFIDVDLKNTKPDSSAKQEVIVLAFDKKRMPPQGMDNWVQTNYDPGKAFQTVRFPVDEKFAWFLRKEMSEFSIYLNKKPNLSVAAARLNDGKTIIPSLSAMPATLKESNDGVRRPIKFPLEFHFDVSNIPGAVSCYCELSRPRSMFQLENFTYRDIRPSQKSLQSWTENGTTGSILIRRDVFPDDACYQLRIFAQRADGRICGASSDLIDLGIDDRPRGQEL